MNEWRFFASARLHQHETASKWLKRSYLWTICWMYQDVNCSGASLCYLPVRLTSSFLPPSVHPRSWASASAIQRGPAATGTQTWRSASSLVWTKKRTQNSNQDVNYEQRMWGQKCKLVKITVLNVELNDVRSNVACTTRSFMSPQNKGSDEGNESHKRVPFDKSGVEMD